MDIAGRKARSRVEMPEQASWSKLLHEMIKPMTEEQTMKLTMCEVPRELQWHIYQKCPPLNVKARVAHPICNLPIFKKK
jgi:hypothetical protein